MPSLVGWLVVLLVGAIVGSAHAQPAQSAPAAWLTRLVNTGPAPEPWHFTTLPHKNPTRFEVVRQDGQPVLKVEADDSYGNLVHPVRVALDGAATLAWRWRVERFVDGADLRSRGSDDGAAKLCVFFALPTDRLPFSERTRLALARSATGEDVPSETLCYVWDEKEAKNTLLPNAFTRRIRMLVLESGAAGANAGGWRSERRNLLPVTTIFQLVKGLAWLRPDGIELRVAILVVAEIGARNRVLGQHVAVVPIPVDLLDTELHRSSPRPLRPGG